MQRRSRKKTNNTENPILTMRQIRMRYKSEWVVVSDPETDEALNVLSGRVVCHGVDKNAVYRKAAKMRLKRSAAFFAGRIPKSNMVIVF